MASLPLPRRKERRRPPPDGRRFAEGTRSVADLIAPAAVEIRRDHLRLDRQFVRTLVVTGYPRTVSPSWLSPLIDFEEPIEVSLHLYPLETTHMVSTLSHKMVQLHSSRMMAARGGRLPDPEREVAYEDAERLRDALQRGEERIFSVSLYIALRAGTLAELDALTVKVETTLGGMLAHSRVALLEQDSGFRSCLPQAQDALMVARNLDTSSVATMFPFSSSSLSMERGVLYGIALHNHSPVIVDPFDESLENANTVIFATSGAGKSYFTKLMALRNLLFDVDFLVIDPEDEYRALCSAVGGQYIRLASSSGQHLNPFDLPPAPDDEDGRDPLAEQIASLHALLEIMLSEPGGQLTTREHAVLDRALYATYAEVGITPDVSTHGRSVPLLRDLDGKILPDGSVADNASVALHRLRRDMERQKKSIQESLERFLKAHRDEGILQEEFVTIRNERFVVPLIAGQRREHFTRGPDHLRPDPVTWDHSEPHEPPPSPGPGCGTLCRGKATRSHGEHPVMDTRMCDPRTGHACRYFGPTWGDVLQVPGRRRQLSHSGRCGRLEKRPR